MGLRPFNQKASLIPIPVVSSTVPPHAPVSNIVVAGFGAPANGRLAVAVVVAVAGVIGDSVNAKQTVRLRNAGFDGAGTTVISPDTVLKDSANAIVVAQGTKLIIPMLASAANVKEGEIIQLHHTDAGTVGTGSRATFTILGFVFESVDNMDPTASL